MKKIGILVFSLGLLFADTSSEIDVFSRKPISEQNKIIEKRFKVLDKLMVELDGIISNIDDTRRKIEALQNRDNTCDVVELLRANIVNFELKLSKVEHKTSKQYINLHKSYLETKRAYGLAKQESHCK